MPKRNHPDADFTPCARRTRGSPSPAETLSEKEVNTPGQYNSPESKSEKKVSTPGQKTAPKRKIVLPPKDAKPMNFTEWTFKTENSWDIVEDMIKDQHAYIELVRIILENFRDKMDDNAYNKLMPWLMRLRSQKKRIFTNVDLQKIKDFQEMSVSPFLDTHKDNYSAIVNYFEKEKKEIGSLYQKYFGNLHESLQIIHKYKPDNKFFKKCMDDCNQKKDILSLMEDVKLWLPNLISNLEKLDVAGKRSFMPPSMDKVLSSMRDILKRCNDLSLIGSIKGYSGAKLRSSGKLIRHGPLHVQARRYTTRSELLYLFVFEKVLLLCKEESNPKKMKSYKVKHYIQPTKNAELYVVCDPDEYWKIGCYQFMVPDDRNSSKIFYLMKASSNDEKLDWYIALKQMNDTVIPVN